MNRTGRDAEVRYQLVIVKTFSRRGTPRQDSWPEAGWARCTGRPTPFSSGRWRSRCSPIATRADPEARAASSAKHGRRAPVRRAARDHGLRCRRARGAALHRDGVPGRGIAPRQGVGRRDRLQRRARLARAGGRGPGHGPPAWIVHRDVKPANLLLDRSGSLQVLDFGIASAAGLDTLTLPGTILGTAGYLAPEQARGEPATAASDRYALGVVAFELLTGRRPYAADTAAHGSVRSHQRSDPERDRDHSGPRRRRRCSTRQGTREGAVGTSVQLQRLVRNFAAPWRMTAPRPPSSTRVPPSRAPVSTTFPMEEACCRSDCRPRRARAGSRSPQR